MKQVVLEDGAGDKAAMSCGTHLETVLVSSASSPISPCKVMLYVPIDLLAQPVHEG